MTNFKLVCSLCRQPVTGDPVKHLLEAHNPLEFFALVPVVTWEKLGVRPPPPPEPKEAKEEDVIQ